MGDPEQAEEWLSEEDTACRSERLARLEWLASVLPPADYLTFPGGLMSKMLFEEMRYCFAYGQFLATIVVGLAYIERTLAAKLYVAGRDDLERAGIGVLLREACGARILTREEAANVDRIRRTRNPVTHFRRPGHEDSIESRSVAEKDHLYQLLENDARTVVEAAMKALSRDVV